MVSSTLKHGVLGVEVHPFHGLAVDRSFLAVQLDSALSSPAHIKASLGALSASLLPREDA